MNTSARSILFIVPLALASAAATASPSETRVEYTDSVHALGELNVVALKQEAMLRDDAVSATVVGSAELDALNTAAMKGISDVVPNFYIPDYGSRITSTMYVRGIGARMDQPAVGLNVDNVPYLNKNAYDFDLADIESVEMLRRRHIDAENRVGFVESGERELRCLHADIIDVESRGIDGFDFLAEHDACGCVDEVMFENLADEGERAGSAEVAFNHLHVIVLGKILDVERT